MRYNLDLIVEKKVKGVIEKRGTGAVKSQIFILFTDNTYCEFYNDISKIEASCLLDGGEKEIKNYMNETCEIVDSYIEP